MTADPGLLVADSRRDATGQIGDCSPEGALGRNLGRVETGQG